MVQGCQSCIPSLAAGPLSAARSAALTPTWVISPAETRIGGRRCGASGRLSRRGRRRREIATGSRGCRYKTASGRRKWPNRDPLGEAGFEALRTAPEFDERERAEQGLRGRVAVQHGVNLYAYELNDPLNQIDALGLEPMLPPGWRGPGQPYDPSFNPFAGPQPDPIGCLWHYVNPPHCPFYRIDMGRRCAFNWKEWGYRSYWDCVTANFVCYKH